MDRVVTIDLGEHNTVMVGHDRFFVFRSAGKVQLVRDSCPHRGGPLSLARLTPDGKRLSCPWHGTRVGVAALMRTAIPMVRTGDQAAVILTDVDAEAPISVIRRRILANLPPVAHDEGGPGMARERERGARAGVTVG